jgi:hypothetical protein
MKQRAAIRENGAGGGIPRPNTGGGGSSSSPSKLAVRTNSRLVVAAAAPAGNRQEPLGRTLSAGGDQPAGGDQSKAGGGLQVLDAGYKMLGGGGGVAYSRGGGGQRALVSDKLYPRWDLFYISILYVDQVRNGKS